MFSPSGNGFCVNSAQPAFGRRSVPLHLSHNSGHSVTTNCCKGTASSTNKKKMQLTETDQGGHQMTLDIPGLNEADVRISCHGSTLTVAGGRRIVDCDPRTKSTTKVVRAFQHSVSLPNGADLAAIAASVADGVLTVHIPPTAAAFSAPSMVLAPDTRTAVLGA